MLDSTRYTGDGSVIEAKGLKHRAADATREVPLSPVLVRQLREHLDRFEPVDGRVFSNAQGRPPTSTNSGWAMASRRGRATKRSTMGIARRIQPVSALVL